jgi:polyphosphate kinase
MAQHQKIDGFLRDKIIISSTFVFVFSAHLFKKRNIKDLKTIRIIKDEKLKINGIAASFISKPI